MIITKKFVFIHLPKTGGTFVSSQLENIYNKRVKNKSYIGKVIFRVQNKYFIREFKKIIIQDNIPNISGIYGQHGGCSQIPSVYKHLPVLSTMRNPFDRYISLYKFKWWVREPIVNSKEIKKSFAKYPNLDFKEYYELSNTLFLQKQLQELYNNNIGLLSWQFIRFFFKDPYEIIKDKDLPYYSKEKLESLMYKVYFIYSENLNKELYVFLKDKKFKEKEITHILNADKIFPKNSIRTVDDTVDKYINPKMKDIILEKERILFTLFPQYQ